MKSKLTESLLNPGLEFLVTKLLELQLCLRLKHWKTTSFAAHEALGKTYQDLDGLLDEFVETAQGIHGRLFLDGIQITGLDVDFEGYRQALVSFPEEVSVHNTDLLSLRDEMLQKLDKLSYLLSLS